MQVDLILVNLEKRKVPKHEAFVFLSSLVLIFFLVGVSFFDGVACLGNASNILFKPDDIFVCGGEIGLGLVPLHLFQSLFTHFAVDKICLGDSVEVASSIRASNRISI